MGEEGNHSQERPVFCDRKGGWLRRSHLRRQVLKTLIRQTNEKVAQEVKEDGVAPHFLPEVRFHDIRHTRATLLLSADENVKVVSERLGRSTVQMTLETYSHVLPTMQKQAAK